MRYKDLSPELQALNREVDRYLGRGLSVSPQSFGTPRIGITMHSSEYGSSLALAYSEAIIKAGGTPLLLPISSDIDYLHSALSNIDGLLLSGGDDINPLYMGEEPVRGLGKISPLRDKYELIIIRLARSLALPILGICRGHQVLGVAYGSLLYQDLVTQHHTKQTPLEHSPDIPRGEIMHRASIAQQCRLRDILGTESIGINSLHHQSIKYIRSPFYETAVASDGINEAIDSYPELDILGVQWHPEQLVASGNEEQLKLFEHLVERANLYAKARRFHSQYITLDSHTDTPMHFNEEFDMHRYSDTLVDIPKLELGQISSTIMVAYLPQEEVSDEAHQKAYKYVVNKLEELKSQVDRGLNRAVLAKDLESIRLAKQRGQIAIIPAVENGYAIGNSIERLRTLKEKYGIVYMTLCHNGDNVICDSASKTRHTHGGLSPFGREVIREMNNLGILIDVSHAGANTVHDVLELSQAPIIASHSSVYALCNHPRNLTDEQIKSIADHGGVIQVCLYAGFIRNQADKATYLDAVDHIEYIINLVGIEHVGIGSDFDGDGELIGCRSSEDLIRITIELLRRGYTERDLSLIWGENILRVLSIVERTKL